VFGRKIRKKLSKTTKKWLEIQELGRYAVIDSNKWDFEKWWKEKKKRNKDDRKRWLNGPV
jgi:hypothetical protein